jgi:hypothetical protein
LPALLCAFRRRTARTATITATTTTMNTTSRIHSSPEDPKNPEEDDEEGGLATTADPFTVIVPRAACDPYPDVIST